MRVLTSEADQVFFCVQVPAKPSLYVAGVLRPLETLRSRFGAVLGPEETKHWCMEVITSTTRKWVCSGWGGAALAPFSVCARILFPVALLMWEPVLLSTVLCLLTAQVESECVLIGLPIL